MNDFTITECSCCQIKLMRSNFSYCKDCDKVACAHTDEPCGVVCPVCDWFVCGSCLVEHSGKCWQKDDDTQITTDGQGGIVYTFHQEEKTKMSDRITVFATSEGYITQIIIKKEQSEAVKSENCDSKNA